MFERDLEESDQISLKEWKKRSPDNHLKEWSANLLKHLL
jgi:hypothetical protein